MDEGIDITLTLTDDTQFVATEVDGAAAIHVGIGESGFTLTGEHEALRSLANMILHALDDNCPQCKSESAPVLQACPDCQRGDFDIVLQCHNSRCEMYGHESTLQRSREGASPPHKVSL